MLPEFIKDFFIDSYTLMAIIGVLSLILYVVLYLEKRLDFSKQRVNKILILGAISGIVTVLFALLFDLLVHYLKSGEIRFGVTFLGGVIPGLVCFILLNYFFNKDERESLKEILNVLVRGIILGHMFGRIGCFLAGCCYGTPTESFLGVIYPDVPYSPRWEIFAKYGEGVKVHPVQIYEALFLLGLFLLLHFIPKLRKNSFVLYLFSYGIFRFLIEFIRGDDRGRLFAYLSPSQILSLVLIVMGVIVLGYRYRKKGA
ncbi:MAG TPA: prolipoprotein diacylglyceryl transferase [Acholeplasma sp.]|nr:prolipoprotein diacylglyceryl transferase [Acholeplasma sp.]